jgi:lipoyl(octanoyl) transferase
MSAEPKRITKEGVTTALVASWLGTVDYAAAWSWQRELFLSRLEEERPDTLMLLEHPHTYTLGRRATSEDLLYSDNERVARGISTYEVDRGGRATYHGPGQLVGYPILALGGRYDVVSYLRRLEGVLIDTAAELGVEAHRDPENTGVWIGNDKLGAIGVKITRGITMHGFAFNVTTDLSMFGGIVPCGIQDRWVTSIEAQTGRRRSVKEVAQVAARHLAEAFGLPLVWAHPSSLHSTGLKRSEGEAVGKDVDEVQT